MNQLVQRQEFLVQPADYRFAVLESKPLTSFSWVDKATYHMLDKVADQPFPQRVLNLWDIQIVSKCDLKQNMQINCNFRS